MVYKRSTASDLYCSVCGGSLTSIATYNSAVPCVVLQHPPTRTQYHKEGRVVQEWAPCGHREKLNGLRHDHAIQGCVSQTVSRRDSGLTVVQESEPRFHVITRSDFDSGTLCLVTV
jgi:hypothetical protein